MHLCIKEDKREMRTMIDDDDDDNERKERMIEEKSKALSLGEFDVHL